MIQSISNLLISGCLLEAQLLVVGLDIEALRTLLLKVGFETPSIAVYTLILQLMSAKEETTDMHLVAHDVLVHPLCHLDGAYSAALYHLRRASELRPEDLSLLEDMLFFNYVPDKPLSDIEGLRIANSILVMEPNSPAALEFIQQYRARTKDDGQMVP